MSIMEIRKDGFYDIDGVRVEDLAYYMKSETTIGEGVTLENLFDSLFKYKGIDVLFKGWTLGVDIYQYYDEMKKKEADTELSYLEISKSSQIWEFEGIKEIDDHNNFTARKEDEEIGYALDFTPIYSIKELEIKLDNTYKVYDEDSKEVINVQRQFTFDEIIGTILFDITFHGDIDHRDSVADSLKETAERIDNGEEKLYTMEEVMEESLQMMLDRAVEEEDYERAAELRERINESKKDE